uniref:Histone-lysine N-methyltransferase SETMAR n=1 Tax=Caenorhabditis japonica TaxID=281687 RepID=A0A8R1EI36_CAEJA
MDYHCDIPLVLTLLKSDFVGIKQFTNCADNFPFIHFTGSTTAVSPTADVSLMRLRNWFARFQLGEKCFEDNNRCGRPTTLNNDLLRHQLASLALALREKRPRRSAVHLLHDSARRHVTKATQAKLQELHWDTVSHPPYSPDIAPSDYHLFRPLKLFLKEKRFAKYEDLKIAVLDFFDSQSAAFWKKGIDDSCD